MSHFAGAKRLGATEAEIAETVQLAAAVGAGVVLAMADRAHDAADAHHYWWRPSRAGNRPVDDTGHGPTQAPAEQDSD